MEEIFNNGKNTILIDKDHCYLRVYGKKKVNTWMLDRDMRAVEQIKKHISKYGNFIANGDGKNGKLKEVVYVPTGHMVIRTEKYTCAMEISLILLRPICM